MTTEYHMSGEQAKKTYEFQKPRWEAMLNGFQEWLPKVFEDILHVSGVEVHPHWVKAMIDDVEVEYPPIGTGRFAEIYVDFNYIHQNYSQIKILRDVLEGTVKSPLFYNRCFASITIYDGEQDRARIRMQVFDTLDSQLKLFEDPESMQYLVNELRGKIRDHVKGTQRLNDYIEVYQSAFSKFSNSVNA